MIMGNSSDQQDVVNLSKGEKVSLTKVAPSLKKIMVGLGWDTNKYSGGSDFDLDASAFLVDATGKTHASGFVFYGNLHGPGDCVVHQGDNLTGEGDGDDEQILIELDKIPSEIEKVAITVTIYEADERHQNFGMISNAYIRLVDNTTSKEIIRYQLDEDFSTETAIVVGELYKHSNEWKFNAVGSGFAGGLASLCHNYGLKTN